MVIVRERCGGSASCFFPSRNDSIFSLLREVVLQDHITVLMVQIKGEPPEKMIYSFILS